MLNTFDKPEVSMNYVLVEEGVPLVVGDIVLEIQGKTLEKPEIYFGLETGKIWHKTFLLILQVALFKIFRIGCRMVLLRENSRQENTSFAESRQQILRIW